MKYEVTLSWNKGKNKYTQVAESSNLIRSTIHDMDVHINNHEAVKIESVHIKPVIQKPMDSLYSYILKSHDRIEKLS